MAFQLDTSIAIPVRDGDPDILGKLALLQGTVAISVVTRMELEGGVHRDPGEADTRRARLDAMLAAMSVIPFDDRCADAYRAIIQVAGFSRRKMADRMIAAQALVSQATLITRNGTDFEDIPDLDLIVW